MGSRSNTHVSGFVVGPRACQGPFAAFWDFGIQLPEKKECDASGGPLWMGGGCLEPLMARES